MWYVSISPARIWTAIARALTPSFLQADEHELDRSKSTTLDGLRGLACLFVYNEHLTYNFTITFLLGWGVGDNYAWNRLPFIRIFWSGWSMVAIFFVISGYVLSAKPLRCMHDGRVEMALRMLTSSTIRRAIRLFTPTFAAVLLAAVLVQLGAFEASRHVWDEKLYALHEAPPAKHLGFSEQIWDAFNNCFFMLNAWHWDGRSAYGYDLHTWTIPTEFRASMVLFLCLIGLVTMSSNVRIASICGLIAYCFFCERREMICFLSGTLIAAIDVSRDWKESDMLAEGRCIVRRNAISLILLMIGLYLCSIPTIEGATAYGFATITSIVPATFAEPAEYIRTAGAAFTVYGVLNCRPLEWLFTNSMVAYLGRISFALYLIHGNVLKALLHAVFPLIYSILGDEPNHMSTKSLVISWFIGVTLTLPLSLYLSDVFQRTVDMPSVIFAKWFERALTEHKAVGYKEIPLGERMV